MGPAVRWQMPFLFSFCGSAGIGHIMTWIYITGHWWLMVDVHFRFFLNFFFLIKRFVEKHHLFFCLYIFFMDTWGYFAYGDGICISSILKENGCYAPLRNEEDVSFAADLSHWDAAPTKLCGADSYVFLCICYLNSCYFYHDWYTLDRGCKSKNCFWQQIQEKGPHCRALSICSLFRCSCTTPISTKHIHKDYILIVLKITGDTWIWGMWCCGFTMFLCTVLAFY